MTSFAQLFDQNPSFLHSVGIPMGYGRSRLHKGFTWLQSGSSLLPSGSLAVRRDGVMGCTAEARSHGERTANLPDREGALGPAAPKPGKFNGLPGLGVAPDSTQRH